MIARRIRSVVALAVLTCTLASGFAGAAASPAVTAQPTPTATSTPTAQPLASPSPVPSPSPTPEPIALPPPPVAPPDASAISATTPPIGDVTPAPAPTVPDSLWLASGDTTTIHIDIHAGRVFVPVVVDGGRREFLLSTVEQSSIDDTLYSGTPAGADRVQTLQVGDVRLNDVSVSRARIAPYSLTYLGYEADGILGLELFARYPVTIDYPSQTLTIYRTEDAASKARPVGAAVTPLEVVGGNPAVTCAVDGRSSSPCFVDVNSDADVTLDWNSEQAQSLLKLGKTLTCMREAAPGHEMFGRLAQARDLSIGSISVAKPLVELPNPAQNPSTNPLEWRTSIGGGVIGRYAATIDEPGGVLVLASDNPSPSPIEFDRSGMWLIWRNDGVVVRNVVAPSPASAAGIAAGDLILSVNGKPAIDLDAVRALLAGDAGSQVSLTYEHGERQSQAVLTLRDLF